ncbi:hypothetical protein DOTSEDRAFT_49041 [Dothistroma septosporum NZE10]|uniref:AAA+ ATPase domain-containing protein n=1 Tax=Dothistroma septosporum (strain NZE10 / CBS 128990) TaxID=675120 RepID=N1PYL8_DOTSN|nr:hypothetical protein DOTSEDRAFT_49041 [Dothistroma septosporum NZE10]
MHLSGALDNEVNVAVQRFLADGVAADVLVLYTALQRSNSSLKRRPRKAIQASIERVLDFLGASEHDGLDSDAIIEDAQPEADRVAESMNRSLRANLAPRPVSPSPPAADDNGAKKRKPNGESLPKRLKREEKISTSAPMEVSLDDVGGMDDVIKKMNRLIVMPIGCYEDYHAASLPLPKGVLLHGPPGCGKTMLARAYAAELGVPFVEILGPSIVSGMSGESEKGVRDRFEEAKKNAPCLLFIDEIDAIAPKRETSQSQMEKRIVAQLLVSMDEINKEGGPPVIVLAATNRPDSLDPALRRGGRFGTEININVPNEQVRQSILETQTRSMTLAADVDLVKLAKDTAGFVGADLHDLVGKAGAHQMERYEEALEHQATEMGLEYEWSEKTSLAVKSARSLIARTVKRRDLPKPPGYETIALSMLDFEAVLPGITPSSKREGFSTVPDVSWRDVGALEEVRRELHSAIVDPIAKPHLYEAMGRSSPSGVLLWGPPGCGKTLLAKAVAAESKANFIAIKGPELLNKFVGESEAAVRKVFQRARSSVPCVIFFDELDALVPKRDSTGSEASARVVNSLLTELDGMDARTGIYVIAATNRPDMIDEAMLRPGRFGTQLFVDVPKPEGRVEILHALCLKRPVDWSDSIEALVKDPRSDGYSGADLQALLNEAISHAIKRQSTRIQLVDFEHARERIRGSVREVAKYHKLKERFGHR